MTESPDGDRLRNFWNSRYKSFTLSESGWSGAGEALNQRIYACKRQALRQALAALGRTRARAFSVLDAGCGQGHFARFYRHEYPSSIYLGLDISERAVAHLQQAIPGAEFRVADLTAADPQVPQRLVDAADEIDSTQKASEVASKLGCQ